MSNARLAEMSVADKKQVYNFGAGPAMLPKAVMEQAQAELLDWQGSGISVIEMSHRSKEFASIVEESEADLRELLQMPDNYKILFIQGGATSQFAMVPVNLTKETDVADYVLTGSWSQKAIKDAERHCQVNVVASSKEDNFRSIPTRESWNLSDKPAYLYYTSNETIGGVEFQQVPDVGDIPLVSDMTSNFLSRAIDVSRFGVIYAGAQKNFGPSGLVIAIVREDLIGHVREGMPTLYDYAVYAKDNSLYNTPPTFSWYMAGLVFKWMKQQGGLAAMEENAILRSTKLYQAIDDSDFYSNPIATEFRSRMNVPFILADNALDKTFLSEAEENGFIALKGHRSVGGMRASIYNGMTIDGIDALIAFMQDFEKRKA